MAGNPKVRNRADNYLKQEIWPIEAIIEYPRNPRTHPDSQIDLLAKLIKKHGVDQPIVVDEDGVIIKGHGRRLAALKAGMKTFPVVVHRGLSESDKRALRIADNQVTLLSGWDAGMLRMEVSELNVAGDYDLDLLGFDEEEIAGYLRGGPEAPEDFREVDENIETESQCPKCGYRWSGGKPAAEG